MATSFELNRRSFLSSAALLAAGVAMRPGTSTAAEPAWTNRFPICTFVKYLQTLSFDELADAMAGLGLQGIEATVRTKGQILPENVEEQLPQLVDALQKRNLSVMIMASSVNRVDQPLTEKVLRTAASLGIKRYRMDYYSYDLSKPILPQLQALKPVVKELAALNRELGIQGIYQNHAGATYVGAGIWDMQQLLEGIPKEDIGLAYDIRHATVEGGTTWQTTWNLAQPHLASVYVKETSWHEGKLLDGPLGMPHGVVDPKFFKMLLKSDFSGPISLHVEYLPKGSPAEQIDSIRSNLKTLKESLDAAG